MEKIYGYKQDDVIKLAEFLKQRKNQKLSSVFENFAQENNKAKGTVRNLYYALAKKSTEDSEFCLKYFDGKPLSVNKIIEFTEEQQKSLIRKVLLMKKQGRSVRSAIMELANGDAKLALRYQNKFRNAMKSNPELVKKIALEIGDNADEFSPNNFSGAISDAQFKRVKSEINGLVDRISLKVRKENVLLKERIGVLERENQKLYALLVDKNKIDAIKYFRLKDQRSLLN